MQTAINLLFWNPDDRRLRALWSVIVHFLVIFVGLQLVGAVLRLILSSGEGSNDTGQILSSPWSL